MSYFSSLFSSKGVQNCDEILGHITPSVIEEMNSDLERPFTDEEIKSAVFQMHLTKAPGPDGMSPGFYQKHWGVVGADICTGVRSMLYSAQILWKINYTHVTLIPMVKDTTLMTQLGPIISPTHNAFISGWLISDNYLVVVEVAHYMHERSSGFNGLMALKLDISKAYDRVE